MERQRRYPSDLTDAQWEIVEPMLPLIKSPGRIPKHPRRAIVDAILYVVGSGCSWRQLPVDLPPWQTVYWQFQQWEKRQVTERRFEHPGQFQSPEAVGQRGAQDRHRLVWSFVGVAGVNRARVMTRRLA